MGLDLMFKQSIFLVDPSCDERKVMLIHNNDENDDFQYGISGADFNGNDCDDTDVTEKITKQIITDGNC